MDFRFQSGQPHVTLLKLGALGIQLVPEGQDFLVELGVSIQQALAVCDEGRRTLADVLQHVAHEGVFR